MSTPAVMIKKSLKRKDIVEKWENLKVLIIDEISMLDIRLFELLDQMAKTARKSDAPFGGVQLIVVGDFLQLPPVRTSPPKSYSNQKYAIPEPPPRNELFCFESSCWEAAGLNTPNGSIRLKEVVRQSDGDFISLLNRIRVGDSSNELMSLLESCVVGNKTLPTDGIVPTKLYCLNKDVDEENASKLAAILEDEIIISSDDTWKIIPVTIANRKRLHEMADKIIPSNLILKRGAQVVLLRNRANDVAKYNRKFAVGIAPGKKP
jgi:ATP-dependent DNA helicase PIF1